jgi:hypothetical protein
MWNHSSTSTVRMFGMPVMRLLGPRSGRAGRPRIHRSFALAALARVAQLIDTQLDAEARGHMTIARKARPPC